MEKKSTKNIKTAFFLNLFFSMIELVGGIVTNSISIISDSVHDFGDAISIAIAWVLEKKSEKEPDKKYTYGYARYSVLGALIASVILVIGSVVMLYNAIPRIIRPEEVNYDGVLILAILGLAVNGFGAYKTAKGNSLNERTISLHLLEDVLNWAAVLAVGVIMKIFDLPILDPILSIGIVIFILMHVVTNIREIFAIFLEKTPEDVDIDEIGKELLKNQSIEDVHHMHVWSADGVNKYITIHVQVDDETDNNKIIEIKKDIRHRLEHCEINHATIEIEFASEECEEQECKRIEETPKEHKHYH